MGSDSPPNVCSSTGSWNEDTDGDTEPLTRVQEGRCRSGRKQGRFCELRLALSGHQGPSYVSCIRSPSPWMPGVCSPGHGVRHSEVIPGRSSDLGDAAKSYCEIHHCTSPYKTRIPSCFPYLLTLPVWHGFLTFLDLRPLGSPSLRTMGCQSLSYFYFGQAPLLLFWPMAKLCPQPTCVPQRGHPSVNDVPRGPYLLEICT